ncbi:MAG: peptidoglycan DD-metalloendopeptidase family protein [Candidatus Latescibacterota bacterium]
MTYPIPSSRIPQRVALRPSLTSFLPFLSLLFPLLLMLSSPSVVFSQPEDLPKSIEAERKKLEKMKKDQAAYVARVEALKESEGRISTEMDQLDRKVDATQRALRKIQSEEKRLKQHVTATHHSLDQTQEHLVRKQRLFSERLRTMYKRGRLNNLELLVSAENFPDFYRRWKGLSLVAQWDKDQLSEIRQDRVQLQVQTNQLKQSHRAQIELRQRQSTEESRLKRQQTQKKQALEKIKKDVTRFNALAQQQAQDITQSQAAIAHFIEELEKRRQKASGREGGIAQDLPFEDMAKQKGSLKWPIRGELLTRFGRYMDPQLKTWTFNRGIDIQIQEGSEIRAAAPGLVVLSDWYRGYGRFLLLDHGLGYFTLYAHLAETFPELGSFVRAGEPIAITGKAGLNDTPKFHFEILKGKEPLDPLEWLQN